jgi:hypothetical protein
MKQSSDAKATQLQNELETAQFKCTKINEESEVLRGHIQVRKTSKFLIKFRASTAVSCLGVDKQQNFALQGQKKIHLP